MKSHTSCSRELWLLREAEDDDGDDAAAKWEATERRNAPALPVAGVTACDGVRVMVVVEAPISTKQLHSKRGC